MEHVYELIDEALALARRIRGAPGDPRLLAELRTALELALELSAEMSGRDG